MTSPSPSHSPDVLAGLASLQKGDMQEARNFLERALLADPNDANAAQLLGVIYLREGKIDDAMELIQIALSLRPNHVGALNNLGFCHFAREEYYDAAAYFEQALEISPENPTTHYNLANAYFSTDDFEDAERHYRAAYNLKPDYVEALGLYVYTSRLLCSWSDVAASEALIRLATDGEYAGQPFVLLSLVDDPAVHLNAARSYVARMIPSGIASPLPARAPHARTRIAYVSRDFGQSAVAHLIAGLLEDHDRARFEIYGVSLGPNDGSDLRRRLEQGVDHFLDVHGQSEAEIAETLRGLEIDIAVDLNGHTRANKMALFAFRPAPIQVAYLGYSATSGNADFDYVIADSTVIPADQKPFYSEKIWPLPGCYLPLDAHRAPAADTPSRADCGLPADGFVFCCFNNAYKINPEIFEIWMRLLTLVEESVLWLASGAAETEKNLRHEAESRGVAPERLVFAPKLPDMAQHLARYRVAGLFLDTSPYNASTTASDALSMGLPVVTMSGRTYASRMAGSILHAVGLPELVTQDFLAYERLALALATDPARLSKLKQHLESARGSARLFDADQHRREMEAAFDGMMAQAESA